MKIRKWLSLLLALILLIGILCGCGSNDSTLRDDDDDDDRRPSASTPQNEPTDPINIPTTPRTPTEPVIPDAPSTPSSKIDMSKISEANDFSEGLAFVKLSDIKDKTFCINKDGEIIFTLEGNYNCGTFHNGIAFVYDVMQYGKVDVLICDETGKLTSASDLGATAFVTIPYLYGAQSYDCHFGDYILVEKTTSTFAGSTDELGILNCDLEYVVEPSEGLFKLYRNYYKNQLTAYCDGYLILDHRYLNLRNGEEGDDIEQMYQNIQLQNQSDLWTYKNSKYIDIRDNVTKIDLTQYEETLYRVGSFENGTAPLLFRSVGASGYQYYFTILGEDGQFAFDPQPISSEYSIIRENNTYLLWNKTNTREGFNLSILLFDENGILEQYETEFSGSYCFVSLSDQIVRIDPYNGQNFYYTQDFEPLF